MSFSLGITAQWLEFFVRDITSLKVSLYFSQYRLLVGVDTRLRICG